MELEFSTHIFKQYSDIKFQKIPSSGSQVVPYRRTDGWTHRHDKANSNFCNFMNAPKNSPCLYFTHSYCNGYIGAIIWAMAMKAGFSKFAFVRVE
jgi:hypothetical protein